VHGFSSPREKKIHFPSFPMGNAIEQPFPLEMFAIVNLIGFFRPLGIVRANVSNNDK